MKKRFKILPLISHITLLKTQQIYGFPNFLPGFSPSSSELVLSVRIGKLQSCSIKETPLLIHGESKASTNTYKPTTIETATQRYISSVKLARVINQQLERGDGGNIDS
ncbi:unnamed protein product [Sphenostylis stenocarpa]|uniref:Uncharacterized protein n=1 Tax=Sphenostylis stenocarpa TaxID=92480 RepID=A0AA86VL25_9FABA|nr:unnamed protein product [Sphenostylis stenocarpa]